MITVIKDSFLSTFEESNILISTQTTSIQLTPNKLTTFISSKYNALREIELDEDQEDNLTSDVQDDLTSSLIFPGRINRTFRKTSINNIEEIPHLKLN